MPVSILAQAYIADIDSIASRATDRALASMTQILNEEPPSVRRRWPRSIECSSLCHLMLHLRQDLRNGSQVCQILGANLRALLCPSGFLAVCSDLGLSLLDAGTLAVERSKSFEDTNTWCVAYAPNGYELALGCSSFTAILNGESLACLRSTPLYTATMAYAPNGELIAVSSGCHVRLLCVQSLEASYVVQLEYVYYLAFGPSGLNFAVSRLIIDAGARCIHVMRMHHHSSSTVVATGVLEGSSVFAYAPSGELFHTLASRGRQPSHTVARLIEPESLAMVREMQLPISDMNHASYTSSGYRLIVGSAKVMFVLDAATLTLLGSLDCYQHQRFYAWVVDPLDKKIVARYKDDIGAYALDALQALSSSTICREAQEPTRSEQSMSFEPWVRSLDASGRDFSSAPNANVTEQVQHFEEAAAIPPEEAIR